MTGTIDDVIKSAKALGRGALISKAAARERIAPTTAGLPGFSQSLYYGLGVMIPDTWEIQNPELNGYTAIQAYLPSRRISVALAVTKGERAAATATNYSEELFQTISEYLTPDHPAKFSRRAPSAQGYARGHFASAAVESTAEPAGVTKMVAEPRNEG
jgi:hypothetical protein